MLKYEYKDTQEYSMKNDYTKNIKVNIYEVNRDGSKKRTSTTLSYQICDFYFSKCLYSAEAEKILTQSTVGVFKKYREFLVARVQGWANTQTTAISSQLEAKLLNEIYAHAYQEGLKKNKDNLGLEFD